MSKKQLLAAVGGLSQPSKMPGFAWGTPAEDCLVGSYLVHIEGSVCSKCYALRNNYRFPNVKRALRRRLDIMNRDPVRWARAMVPALEAVIDRDDPYFRWSDSGDVQHVAQLRAMVLIARALPWVAFYLPTKEPWVIEYFATHERPVNLVIRKSAPMIGKTTPPRHGCQSASVSAGVGFSCPAPEQENNCGKCRACWDSSVPSIDYHEH